MLPPPAPNSLDPAHDSQASDQPLTPIEGSRKRSGRTISWRSAMSKPVLPWAGWSMIPQRQAGCWQLRTARHPAAAGLPEPVHALPTVEHIEPEIRCRTYEETTEELPRAVLHFVSTMDSGSAITISLLRPQCVFRAHYS
jgi:hypothetical protein